MLASISISRIPKLLACAFLTILIMVIIYMLSGQNGEESGSLSERVSWVIAPYLIWDFDSLSNFQQQSLIDILSWPIRKTAHASEYAMLALSMFGTCWQVHAMRSESRDYGGFAFGNIRNVAIVAFVLTVLYACTDEIHQLLIDGRAGQLIDVCVDASGAFVALLFVLIVGYVHMRRR